MGHHLLRHCRTLWIGYSIHGHTWIWIWQFSLCTWIAESLQRKILNSSVEFHSRDHCWDVSQHSCKNASAAFLDPIALVQPRQRLHTVGGAEFSVVWKEKAPSFSVDSSVWSENSSWAGFSIWLEFPVFLSDGTSVCSEHSNWSGISVWSKYPVVKNDVPLPKGVHEASPCWRPTSLGTGAGRRWSPCRSAPTSPTRTGNLLLASLCCVAVALHHVDVDLLDECVCGTLALHSWLSAHPHVLGQFQQNKQDHALNLRLQ